MASGLEELEAKLSVFKEAIDALRKIGLPMRVRGGSICASSGNSKEIRIFFQLKPAGFLVTGIANDGRILLKPFGSPCIFEGLPISIRGANGHVTGILESVKPLRVYIGVDDKFSASRVVSVYSIAEPKTEVLSLEGKKAILCEDGQIMLSILTRFLKGPLPKGLQICFGIGCPDADLLVDLEEKNTVRSTITVELSPLYIDLVDPLMSIADQLKIPIELSIAYNQQPIALKIPYKKIGYFKVYSDVIIEHTVTFLLAIVSQKEVILPH